jgi:hypothetical protein
MLLPLFCDPNEVHEAEALGALYDISLFLIQNQRSYSFVIFRKILVPPIYTHSIETSRIFSTVLGNLEKPQKISYQPNKKS